MDFDFNDGTVRQGDLPQSVTHSAAGVPAEGARPASSDERVGSRLPPVAPIVATPILSASEILRSPSTERCRINMVLAAEGAGIAAELRRRRTSRRHKLDLLDDLREFRDIQERAEWALEAAQAAVIDAQADVANALFACEGAGCVDICGEPLEEFL